MGDFQTDPVSFSLMDGATPHHGKAFPIPHVHKATFKREVEHLVEIGALKEQSRSEWGSPAFIIAKKVAKSVF